MPFTAEQLIQRHGVALRYEKTGQDSGAWVAAFHFAGPDMVSQGATIESALENFINTVHAYQALEAETKPSSKDKSAADLARWRSVASRLCDAMDRILYEDSDKSERRRLVDRVSAAEMMHVIRSELLPAEAPSTDQS